MFFVNRTRPADRDKHAVLIRHSEPADLPVLERLAALDSQEPPQGSFLLAEVEGEVVAARPLGRCGSAIADPFRRTASTVMLLELRARQLAF